MIYVENFHKKIPTTTGKKNSLEKIVQGKEIHFAIFN